MGEAQLVRFAQVIAIELEWEWPVVGYAHCLHVFANFDVLAFRNTTAADGFA